VSAAVRKPVLRTAVVEVVVPAAREQVWASLVAGLEAATVGASAEQWPELLLSFEPPWRRVARLTILDHEGEEPSPLVEHTAVIRDDGATCLLVWAAVVEVPHDATPERTASCDDVIARLDAAMRRWASAVADTAVRA
jgi:hypothetical protein